MSAYADAITAAMTWLGEDSRTVFMGQAVRFPGTAMTTTLTGVPKEKLIELPVAEEMQGGMAIGMAMTGLVPICIYPRFNFMLLAVSAIVNHLDKLCEISTWKPRVLIRVGIGSEKPLHPGPQHSGDMTEAFRLLLRNVPVIRLTEPADVMPAYEAAMKRDGSTMFVEQMDLYA